jgi:hypothetical protein
MKLYNIDVQIITFHPDNIPPSSGAKAIKPMLQNATFVDLVFMIEEIITVL